MRGRSGFSLIEVLFALFLSGVVLGITARLFSGYRDLTKHYQEKDKEYELSRRVLDAVSTELAESYSTTPATLSGSQNFTLTKRDPQQTLPPAPLTTTYDPGTDASHQVDIRYTFSSGTLVRNDGTTTVTLAREVDGFGVTQTGRTFEVSLTLVQDKKVVVLTKKSFRWRDV